MSPLIEGGSVYVGTIDNVVDSIESPYCTGRAIPPAIMHATALGAAYRFGNAWPVYNEYCSARPDLAKKGWIISTTLTWDCPVGQARLYDIEPGGGSNANAGRFLARAERIHGKPILYTFASNTHDMIVAAASAGWSRSDYYVYAAHPDSKYGKHICGPNACCYPQADATQYTFQAAGNCDVGIFESYVLPGDTPAPTPTPTEDPVTTAFTLGGTLTVVAADDAGNLYQMWQNGPGTDWSGGTATNGQFSPLAPSKGTVKSLSSAVNDAVAEVIVELDSGVFFHLWQHGDDRSWSGGQAGVSVAAMSPLAPKLP